jgi:hypothetical protein
LQIAGLVRHFCLPWKALKQPSQSQEVPGTASMAVAGSKKQAKEGFRPDIGEVHTITFTCVLALRRPLQSDVVEQHGLQMRCRA